MPTYGYRCGSCGHEFEIRQGITAEALTTCPKCGGKLSKMLYPAGIIFKGSGYYTTDYKSAGSDGEKSSSNGAAPSSEGSSESKPESKPSGESKSDAQPKNESKSETKSESKSETKTQSKPDSKSEKKDR
jgi:putative FmdB family regulatory protein